MLLIRDTNGLTQEDREVIWKIMMHAEMAFPDCLGCMAERSQLFPPSMQRKRSNFHVFEDDLFDTDFLASELCASYSEVLHMSSK